MRRRRRPASSLSRSGTARSSAASRRACRPGAAFAPHHDRDPCELSINLPLDYVPEPEGATPWPLFLAGDDGVGRPAELGLGDALFYRGKLLRHWRDPLPEGHAATVVIF